MDFSILKLGFANYLQEKSGENNIPSYENNLDISIFMHADEFKEYLQQELNVDTSLMSMSINDIMDMEVVNGKLVDPNEEEGTIPAEEGAAASGAAETGEAPAPAESQQGPGNIENANGATGELGDLEQLPIIDLLNNIFEDETFKNSIDADLDGQLSEAEIMGFINIASIYDGDGASLTLDDLFAVTEDLKNGTLLNHNKETEDMEIEQSQTSSVPASNAYFHVPDSYTNATSQEPKSIENMNEYELKTELQKAESDLAEKQQHYEDISNGNTPELIELNENIEKAYETYKEQLELVDHDMAEQLDELVTSIDDKQSEIDDVDKKITEQETKISSLENSYDNAVSNKDNLESILSGLESTNTSDMSAEEKSSLEAQMSELRSQISDADEKINDIQKELDEAKDVLENGENGLLKQKEDLEAELADLKEQKTALEADIAEKYPEIQEYMDTYNDLKEEYDTTKTDALKEAKAEIVEAQDHINEINDALTNIENKENVRNYTNELGDKIIDFAKSFLGCNEADGSADKFFKEQGWNTTSAATPWCAAFVSYVLENSGVDMSGAYKFSVQGLMDWGKSNGTFISGSEAAADTSKIKEGDVVIWKDNGRSHTGIVTEVYDNGTFKTIEGNTSNKVAEREGYVVADATGFIST